MGGRVGERAGAASIKKKRPGEPGLLQIVVRRDQPWRPITTPTARLSVPVIAKVMPISVAFGP